MNEQSNQVESEPQGGILTSTVLGPVKQWVFYGKIILLAILLAAIGVQTYRVSAKETKIAKLEGDAKVASVREALLQDDLKKCKGEVADQSKKVEDAAADTAKLLVQFDLFKKNFQTNVEKEVYKRVELIKAEPAPKTCQDATKFLRDHVGGR